MSACPATWSLLALAWESGRPDEVFQHLTSCESCRREYRDMLEDRVTASGVSSSARCEQAMLRGGIALEVFGFPLRARAPVFRAGGIPVLHSAIHPLGRDYVLLELSGWDGDLELHLERGTKNGPDIPISLYMDEELSDQRTLQTRLSYRLTQLAEGSYLLKLREHTVFRFNVHE